MTTRAAQSRTAIDASMAGSEEKTGRHRQRAEDGSAGDVGRELEEYFGGGYKADAGLHCGLGNAGTGASGGIPDGFNDAVKLFVAGADGRMDMMIVASAIRVLDDKHVAPLRAYYTPRPRGTYDGLDTLYHDDKAADPRKLAAVAVVTPLGRDYVESWCRARCEEELARAAELRAPEDTAARIEATEREIAKLEAVLSRRLASPPGPSMTEDAVHRWHVHTDDVDARVSLLRHRLRVLRAPSPEDGLHDVLEQLARKRAAKPHPPMAPEHVDRWERRVDDLDRQAGRLRARIRAAKEPPWTPDVERAIRNRWALRSEQVAIAALRYLCAQAKMKEFTHERRRAGVRCRRIRDQSKKMLDDARDAYADAKRDVRRQINKFHEARMDMSLDDYNRSLNVTPDEDL